MPLALVLSEGLQCPEPTSFTAAVHGHFPEADIALSTTGDARHRVTIGRDVEGVVGVFAIRGAASREVHGATCEEVFAAAALIVALALQEETTPRSDASSEVPPAPTSVLPAPAAMARPPTPPRPPPERAPASSLGASVALVLGLAPSLSAGTRLHGAREIGSLLGLPLALRPTFLLATNPNSGVEGGAARFRLVAGGVDLCRGPDSAHGGLLFFCVGFESGSLRATGVDVEPPRSEARFWLAARAAVGARVALSGPLALAFEGAAVFPVTRDTFFFEGPRIDVHEMPWLLGSVCAGIDVALP